MGVEKYMRPWELFLMIDSLGDVWPWLLLCNVDGDREIYQAIYNRKYFVLNANIGEVSPWVLLYNDYG